MATKYTVTGLGDDANDLFNALWAQLERVATSNIVRDAYYDQDRAIKGLGLNRKEAQAVALCLGWSTKAVDSLCALIVNDGPVIPGAELSTFGIDRMWRDNRMKSEAAQVRTSAVLHSVAFLITSQGDTSVGEPRTLITPKDANSGTGFWNSRKRGLDSFLSVHEVDKDGKPLEAGLYLPGQTVVIKRDTSKAPLEVADVVSSGLNYVPVEPLVYRARTGRPFGSSRLTHAMMNLQDAGLRTLIRSDIAAEDYISPIRVLLNSDMKAFRNPDGTPNAAFYALSKSKTVNIPVTKVDDPSLDETKIVEPKFEQIPGADMSPFSDHYEMWAAAFAGESSIPQSELGVRGSNIPVSAEAILAAKNTLILEAESACRDMETPFVRALQTGWRLENGKMDLPPEVEGLAVSFRDPNAPSVGAQADAVFKQVAANILPAESDVTLERLGYDSTDIERIKADRARLKATTALDSLVNRRGSQQ